MADEKPLRSWCNACCKETDHITLQKEVLEEFEYPDFEIEKVARTVRCLGCRDVAIRLETWHFDRTPEDGETTRSELEYVPPRVWRRQPDWLDQLEQVDAPLRDMLDEVYSAANDRQFRLLAMGVRAALDHAMVRIVGDVGEFKAKLDAMVAADHLSLKQSEALAVVIDAASATAHRGFKPQRELLVEMLIVMEGVIRDYYLTGPMLKQMKTIIPPRPPRQPKVP